MTSRGNEGRRADLTDQLITNSATWVLIGLAITIAGVLSLLFVNDWRPWFLIVVGVSWAGQAALWESR